LRESIGHNFFDKSEKEQRRIQLAIGAVSLVVLFLLSALFLVLGLYPIPFVLVAIVISIVAPFYDVPSMKKAGRLIYYSSLFLAEKEKNGVIRIHGGTLLDYVFVVDRTLGARQRTTQILISYIDGILSLLESRHGSDLEQIKVRGTSYIINEKTAGLVGFKKVENDFIQVILLIYNYPNLVVSYSLSKGQLSFPRISKINTYEATLSDIARRRDYLTKLRSRLTRTR